MEKELEIRAIPKVEMLFEENLPHFNRLVMEGKAPDLKNANLSGLDLRKARLKGLDLSGTYLRNTNLRGVDLSGCDLQGASLQGALISGALFPDDVPAEEIRFSIEYGTRIRVAPTNKIIRKMEELLVEMRRLLQSVGKE